MNLPVQLTEYVEYNYLHCNKYKSDCTHDHKPIYHDVSMARKGLKVSSTVERGTGFTMSSRCSKSSYES